MKAPLTIFLPENRADTQRHKEIPSTGRPAYSVSFSWSCLAEPYEHASYKHASLTVYASYRHASQRRASLMGLRAFRFLNLSVGEILPIPHGAREPLKRLKRRGASFGVWWKGCLFPRRSHSQARCPPVVIDLTRRQTHAYFVVLVRHSFSRALYDSLPKLPVLALLNCAFATAIYSQIGRPPFPTIK